MTRDFWQFVKTTHVHGCWVWTGPHDKKGYGRFGRKVASRHSWELANGPIPAGMWVLHHCDNPPCVNPAHLYLGTVVENVQDMIARGRTYIPPHKEFCPRGHRKTGTNLVVVGKRKVHMCRECENRRSADRQRTARAARGLLKTRLSDEERDVIIALSKGGMSGRRIAKEIGRALVTVQKALKEAA